MNGAARCFRLCLFLACVAASVVRGETTDDVAGYSVEGRPIRYQVLGDGPDVFMVIATIHGDEDAGTPLLAAFTDWLGEHPEELEGRTVVLVPVANPDGMAAQIRYNVNDVDLNRNFPAENWQAREGDMHGKRPLSEPESRALMRLICQFWPHRVISIHQPVACIDYDGPAKRLAEAMGAKCPLPVKQIGSRPGSLGSFVGNTLNRPIITWELPEDAPHDAEQLWTIYGESLLAALRYAE